MDVRLFEDLNEFEGLRADWDAAFESDASATVFVSWPWLRGWFESSPYPWSVIAARSSAASPWVGFLPVSQRGSRRAYRFDQVREIQMGGDPAADYTGLVCAPACESACLEAIADFLAHRLRWDRIRFKEVVDERVDGVLERVASDAVALTHNGGTVCPFIRLPESFDVYLRAALSQETRHTLKKRLRLFEREGRITWHEQDIGPEQIDRLLVLALQRRDDPYLPCYRSIFQHCAQAGFALIATLWMGDTPAAAQGIFIDRKQQSYDVYLSGFDPRFSKFSPGRVLDALCIRHAIERGMKVYDFLRGDEPYKFQFGAEARVSKNFTAQKRGLNAATRIAVHTVRQRLHI